MPPSHDDILSPAEQAQLGVQIWQNAFCAALLDLDDAQRGRLLARLGRLRQTIAHGKNTPSRVNTRAAQDHALHVVGQAMNQAADRTPPLRVPLWCRDIPDCD
ncbi:hypothetical protein LV478_12645 [Komagataeibacter oboediens]|uniref:hypothetical protein n=1 Tax=Komagataeibacter oboediens TaxID=65958 RepID=UPI0019056B89|nr:hypothetical protein [Komagataeibacter oboediens]MBV1822960.1 hypothetical protein [Komagataeibacter oboediens]WEQ51372.1 hypothetical protein LV478_12645 [Komagataeibacter oboediens]GCE78605.1 hypothetical protein MSKU3_0080 [Komagataeibacter oboediens]